MKKRKTHIEKNIIPTKIISYLKLPVPLLPKRGLTVERWNCALDHVSAVLNDQSLLFRDVHPLESLSSKSMHSVFTTPNEE
ncbi:hypothetical protein AYI68_g8108 [Smittium mucronatum]|uniref:Uncharacterized protein n=1 Tax=Smittium mucronatum TaxID=133383 RepID=A0A1R0GLV3_9FUNG|nr:hypothetical protein AYI68_g8108 [Smittium mucronatum]